LFFQLPNPYVAFFVRVVVDETKDGLIAGETTVGATYALAIGFSTGLRTLFFQLPKPYVAFFAFFARRDDDGFATVSPFLNRSKNLPTDSASIAFELSNDFEGFLKINADDDKNDEEKEGEEGDFVSVAKEVFGIALTGGLRAFVFQLPNPYFGAFACNFFIAVLGDDE
jgi:hypothetical protein